MSQDAGQGLPGACDLFKGLAAIFSHEVAEYCA
jgi:hypothetical protein